MPRVRERIRWFLLGTVSDDVRIEKVREMLNSQSAIQYSSLHNNLPPSGGIPPPTNHACPERDVVLRKSDDMKSRSIRLNGPPGL